MCVASDLSSIMVKLNFIFKHTIYLFEMGGCHGGNDILLFNKILNEIKE